MAEELPDVAGAFNGIYFSNTGCIQVGEGAFTPLRSNGAMNGGSYMTTEYCVYNFNLSAKNDIYKNNGTVKPKSLKIIHMIKY